MANPSAADAALQGYTIGGKYRLVRLLGAGGMGAVYEAENAWTRRRVAVKLLRPEFVTNAEIVQRFTQEAQSATQIAHANIVDVLDMGQEPSGALYIVQEFLDGSDLRKVMAAGAMKPSSALAMMVPIIEALGAAHARGVVHRDVKPENIFLAHGDEGELIPKLIDFGISKVLGEDAEARSRTRTGIAMGTPDYMSPEQARGDTSIDARTDVWAVGAVLFEMIAGRPPFDAPSTNLIITKIITERATPITEFVPLVPPDVAALVHRALEPQRARRYQTMAEFRDAVMACSEYPSELRSRRTTARHTVPASFAPASIPAPARPSGDTVVNAAAPPGATQGTTSVIQRSPRPSSNRLALVLAAGLAAIGIAAVVAAMRWERPVAHAPPRAPSRALTQDRTPALSAVTPAPAAPAPVPTAPAPAPLVPPAVDPAEPALNAVPHASGNTAHHPTPSVPMPDLHRRPGGPLRTIDRYSVQ